MNALPKLQHYSERKQSSGDLQSRLKTRKLLGVGECEDGSVPVSKISQILGSDDHYLLALPQGLRLWQFSTALIFTIIAVLALIVPASLFHTLFGTACGPDAILPIRLFGTALSCLGLLFWNAVKSVSRHFIRLTLLSQILYLSIQTTVVMCTQYSDPVSSYPCSALLMTLTLGLGTSLYFYAILSGVTSRWLWRPKMTVYDTPAEPCKME